ncbi:hypothetical protein ACJMK2_008803 [Sinanodonta woodiana]|uniref:Uncharacterized protein n=1 Tax=Sinanodonta woodiana TaxID=1069815 RepID=A0ABD3VMY0_SINWO
MSFFNKIFTSETIQKRFLFSSPPAFHTGTQNKVEPGAISNPTYDRQQPMTPIRPQPVPEQNGEINDRSRRGISATLEDMQGLASDTPRPARLLPLPPKQETIQNKDASKERKKKGKKNKKKDQINEETPEEENGKTNLSVN